MEQPGGDVHPPEQPAAGALLPRPGLASGPGRSRQPVGPGAAVRGHRRAEEGAGAVSKSSRAHPGQPRGCRGTREDALPDGQPRPRGEHPGRTHGRPPDTRGRHAGEHPRRAEDGSPRIQPDCFVDRIQPRAHAFAERASTGGGAREDGGRGGRGGVQRGDRRGHRQGRRVRQGKG